MFGRLCNRPLSEINEPIKKKKRKSKRHYFLRWSEVFDTARLLGGEPGRRAERAPARRSRPAQEISPEPRAASGPETPRAPSRTPVCRDVSCPGRTAGWPRPHAHTESQAPCNAPFVCGCCGDTAGVRLCVSMPSHTGAAAKGCGQQEG